MVLTLLLAGLLLLWMGLSSGRRYARLSAGQGIASRRLKWLSHASLIAAALMLLGAAALFLLAVASW